MLLFSDSCCGTLSLLCVLTIQVLDITLSFGSNDHIISRGSRARGYGGGMETISNGHSPMDTVQDCLTPRCRCSPWPWLTLPFSFMSSVPLSPHPPSSLSREHIPTIFPLQLCEHFLGTWSPAEPGSQITFHLQPSKEEDHFLSKMTA